MTPRVLEKLSKDPEIKRWINFVFGPNYGDNLKELFKELESSTLALHKELNLSFNGTVLDYGSGFGHFVATVANECDKVYSCEIIPALQRYTKMLCQEYNNIEYILTGKREGLSTVPNQTCDFVYARNVFIHLTAYEILFYLKEFHRILKPCGHLIVNINTDQSFKYDAFMLSYQNYENCHNLEAGLEFWHSSKIVERLIKESGYEIHNSFYGQTSTCYDLKSL